MTLLAEPEDIEERTTGSSLLRNMWKKLKSGDTWRGRFVNKRKDGTLYQEDCTISPVRDRSGEIVNFVAVKRDVTHEAELQEQLVQAQKMEAIGTFAGGLAHDFNNILTIVHGFSVILVEMEDEDPAYANLQKIRESAGKGAELVRSLLTFSRKADTRPRPLNLNREVAEIEKLLERTVPKMVKIDLHLTGDLATINVDPGQLGQVLMNLALNAEQAMPDGGNLTIATTNVSLDEEYCRSYPGVQPGKYVLLTVSDTGHGMDKQTLAHIFEPFYTTKRLGKGTGLGLAMVYGIIQSRGSDQV